MSDRHQIIMVHSRTIREATAYFRVADPHSGLTETAIRNLLRRVRVGRKYLVTIEALEAYLMGDTGKTQEKPQKPCKKWKIR